MDEEIEKILKQISKSIENNTASYINNPSFLNGIAGIVLFLALSDQVCKEQRNSRLISKLIQSIDFNEIKGNLRYSDGLSGVLWVFCFLNNRLGFNIDYKNIKDFYFKCLRESNVFNKNHFDFLHGLIGIHKYCYIEKEFNYSNQIYRSLLKSIELKSDMCYLLNKEDINHNTINTSLAHGMASVLSFLIDIYIASGKKEKLYLEKSINFFNKVQKKDELSFFESFVSLNNNTNFTPSRLAWCYGDLGILNTLYRASEVLNNNKLRKSILTKLDQTTLRKSKNNTGVIDLGFCHGSIGVACIYKKLSLLSSQPSLDKAAKYWLEYTMRNLNEFYKNDRFYAYRGESEGWVNSYGMLDGLTGIGLGLITFHSKSKLNWESALYV